MVLDAGPTPLYYQLKSILENKIRSKELKEGERLPSEADLCHQFKVSRITVRQALLELEKSGLIYRERGKGTFISEGGGWKKPVLRGSIEGLMAAGVGTRVQVLSYEKTALPKEFSKVLKLDKSEKVYRLEIVRLMSSGPQAYSLIYFPPKLGKMISRDEITETTEIISFVEDKFDTKAQTAHQTMDVGLADVVLARSLDVNQQTPLLIVYREYYTRTGSLLFLAKSYYRTDRFKYEIELARTGSSR
jgi:GntR family transcriptional regulator